MRITAGKPLEEHEQNDKKDERTSVFELNVKCRTMHRRRSQVSHNKTKLNATTARKSGFLFGASSESSELETPSRKADSLRAGNKAAAQKYGEHKH
jgi:hypothetical protein